MAAQLHITNKNDIKDHHILSLDVTKLPPQAPGTIRCRPLRIGLTSNNLTYARLGTELGWWQTYPVPPYLPRPYNDASTWGIVPAWGVAEVLSSTHPHTEDERDLAPGTHLYGLFPPTTLPVDLSLTPTSPPGHFTETSPPRQNLLALYNHYIAFPSSPIPQDKDEIAATTLIRPLYECAHLLNTVILSPTTPTIHPSGDPSVPWPRKNIDLTATAVVILGASGTTARCTADALLHACAASEGPVCVLRVCRDPGRLSPVTQGVDGRLCYAANYAQATAPVTLARMAGGNCKRIMVLDFGAPGNKTADILSALCIQFPDCTVSCITIGAPPPSSSESPNTSPADVSTPPHQTCLSSADRVQKSWMNTSAVRSRALTLMGSETYYDRLERAWRDFVRRGALESFEVEVRVGVDAFAEGWEGWCRGRGKGMVVRFDGEG